MEQFKNITIGEKFIARGHIWIKHAEFKAPQLRTGKANAYRADALNISSLANDEMAWFDGIAFVESVNQ